MNELLATLKTRLRFSGDVEDDMLLIHLNLAITTLNDRRQYVSTDTDVVEEQYQSIVIEMAVCSYSKIGAEGQLAHDENGVDRMYDGGFYPKGLMKLIVPKSRG